MVRGSWHEAREPSQISVNELAKRRPNLPTELLLYCRLSRNVRGFPTALSAWLFVFRGVYGRKVVGVVEGQLKSGSWLRRLDWSLAVVIQKARQQCSTPSAFGLFLMPFTSKEEAQAVIVGVDLCFEGCSSVWCGEEGGLVMSRGGWVWALNERWERTNETSFSQA